MSIDTAVILCGGRGSRFTESVRAELQACERRIESPHLSPSPCALSHATIRNLENLPKCLLPLKGLPLLAHKIRQLEDAGITRCVIRGGGNADAIRDCIQTYHLDRDLHITVLGKTLFDTGDLAGIARAVKKCGKPEHVIVTAGDCLTTTNHRDLISCHFAGDRYLTISTTNRNDKEAFVQDSVVSAAFIKESLAHSSRMQRHFPKCSPFVAAVQYSWHHHTLQTCHREVHYVNINKLADYERLLAVQDILLPRSLPPRPSLMEYEQDNAPRSHHRTLQP